MLRPPLKLPCFSWFWVFTVLIPLMYPSPCPGGSPAHTSPVGDTAPQLLFEPGSVSRRPTLRLEREFTLPGTPGEIHYLLGNLDVACAIIRAWKLEKFRARRVRPNRYRARDGAGMVGLLQVHGRSDTVVRVLGSGRYRTAALGWTLRGRAVARIDVRPDSAARSTVRARVLARVDHRVMHWVGRLLHPVLKGLAARKADHLIRVARLTLRVIHDHPDAVRNRLGEVDRQYLERWKQYPE